MPKKRESKDAKEPKVKKAKAGDDQSQNQGDGGDVRVIKKYNNRRLYDTQNSRYITLDELKELIISGEEFIVTGADGEDITRQTLITILLSGEVMGQPLFSEQTLRNMVMFMQGPMRGPMKVFFEQCLPLFARSNHELMEKFGSSIGSEELDSLAVLQGNMVRQLMEQYVFRGLDNYLTTQKNMEKMMSMQSPFPFTNMFTPPGMQTPGDDDDKEK